VTLRAAVRAFIEAFDEKRQVTPNIHVGAYLDVIHPLKCPAPRKPCNCGGLEQKRTIHDAFEAMREAAR
jgi:hypothetical protein